MKRILLFAVTALASGCTIGPSGPPIGDLTLYWDFQRAKLDGTTVGYDTNPGPGGASRACPQSGVDTIAIAYSDGTLIDPATGAIPCIFGDAYTPGVQGATIPGLPSGVHDLILTGYHGSVATFEAAFQVTVVEGREVQYSVTLPGIPDDLDVYAHFWDRYGATEAWTSCGTGTGGADVQTLTYNLIDGAGTSVASGSTGCVDPAGLSFRVASGQGVDRDTYTIRLQAYRTGTVTPIFDSATTALSPQCTAQSFGHYGSDVGAAAWDEKLYDVTANPTRCQ
jgi:hypothetical protein